jgi:hypothetical protein
MYVVLRVNGVPYANYELTQSEVKLGPFDEDDTRSFSFVQVDSAGNVSAPSTPLRGLPRLAGLTVELARTELASRGFELGAVTTRDVPGAVAGTVVEPAGPRLEPEGTKIDLVVAGAAVADEPALALRVSGQRTRLAGKQRLLTARVTVTRPARVTATLLGPRGGGVATWRLYVRAGSTPVRLRLPARARRPGRYRVVWRADAAGETVRRTHTLRLAARRR